MKRSHEWNRFISTLASSYPTAFAYLYGDEIHADIFGTVLFFPIWNGTLVVATVEGLPYEEKVCHEQIFGFHIHEGSTCTGNSLDPFADTGGHYNPKNCNHPQHAGDLPPLFGNHGYAFQIFYTERFLPDEIVGRTCIIHDMPDDFRTQPSGNSGKKIACGEIKSILS